MNERKKNVKVEEGGFCIVFGAATIVVGLVSALHYNFLMTYVHFVNKTA